MKKLSRFVVALISLLGFTFINCFAGDIKKGTYSLGASSNILIQSTDYDDGPNSNDFSASTVVGYFLFDNFEIGSSLTLSYADNGRYNVWNFSISPFIMYHYVLNDKSNIFIGAGAGIGRTKGNHSEGGEYDADSTLFFAEAGWEYFVATNLALNLAIRAEQNHYDSDFNDGTVNRYGSILGLKLFF